LTGQAAEPRRLRGNEVLRLDDPSALWIIEQGSVTLFAVPLRDGELDGPRRSFFRCGAGEALFGFAHSGEDGQDAIIAVALEDCSLRRVSALEPDDRPPGSQRTGSELVLRWRACWQRCDVRFDVPLPAAPVSLPRGLDEFQAELLRRIGEGGARRSERERARIEGREQHSAEALAQALSGLTSVLRPACDAVPQGSDLFTAACLVGQSMGISLRRPPAWQRDARSPETAESIADASHVRARQVVLHDRWWRQDCGPLLAYRGRTRAPVALIPSQGTGYLLLDPATRTRIRVDDKLAAELEPEAWIFYRPLPEQATKTVELARFALSGRGRDLLLILVTASLATLLGMFIPQATALLVDQAIPDSDLGLLRQIGFGLLAAAFGIAAFRWSQGIVTLRVETAAEAAMQSAVWDRLLNLQVAFFRRFTTGDLESRVTAVSGIRAYLGGATLRTLFSSVVLLLNLGLLLYYSPRLTLLALGVALLSAAVTVVSGLIVLRYARQVLELKGTFFGLMVQLINGVAKLRVAAAEERAFSRWARDYTRLVKLELQQRTVQDSVQAINIAVSTLSAIVLFSLAASMIHPVEGESGALTTGIFLAFSVAYGTFIGAITRLSNTVTDVMAIAILRERARPILEATPEVSERRADPGALAGRIELDHVSFQYRDDGPNVLDEVTLKIEPGRFVALVGPSGSGKSTLFRLLLGFESPRSGAVFFDGQDLAGLDVQSVRRQVGVVLQNGRITSGSVFDNIVTGTRLSLDDAWAAARAAGFAEEIEAMPMGMHTIVSEGGTNLSGGQRQRLLLARALVHRPQVLLLDEATSALDNKTQAIVSESLNRLQVTRIVIAHRLSTVRNADRIYVIDSGRVAEQGSFDELAQNEGLFARLMARQMT